MQHVIRAVFILAIGASASDVNVDVTSDVSSDATMKNMYEVDYLADVSPVQKVVQLLKDMIAKGKKEAQDEKVQFATYSQWCKDTEGSKRSAIQKESSDIDSLTASIKKAGADIQSLTSQIDKHNANVASLVNQQQNVTDVRTKENTAYNLTFTDYTESIDAMGRALKVLKKQAYDRKQAAAEVKAAMIAEEAVMLPGSFLQLSSLSSDSSPKSVKEILAAFIQQGQAPEVAGYGFQSSGIVTMLEEMQRKFAAEKVELEKAEFAKKASYDKVMADLVNSQADEQKDSDKKQGFKSQRLAEKASMEGNLKATQDAKASDQAYLDDLVTTCKQKATDFEARQKLRVEELEAVNKAIEILSGTEVSGNEAKHLVKSFLQKKVSRKISKTSLAHLRSEVQQDVKDRVVAFLQSEAKRLHSKALARVIAPVVNSGAMVMISNLLKDLVTKLMEENTAETNKKSYCDTNLKANSQTRSEKTAVVDSLTVDIDKLKASVKQISQDIKTLTDEVASIDSAVAKATKIRNKETAENKATMADAQAAQQAVAKAMTVLKEFYDKAAKATALVQETPDSDENSEDVSFFQKSKTHQPPIFDKAYKGMGGENGGVIGMLETIASDFAQLEAETSAQETANQKEFEKLLKESKDNKLSKQGDIKNKKERKTEQSSDIQAKTGELQAAQSQLDAANQVYAGLKDECINTDKSYDKMVKDRNDQIAALKQALEMLNNDPNR